MALRVQNDEGLGMILGWDEVIWVRMQWITMMLAAAAAVTEAEGEKFFTI